jgi:hypothetical protein
MCDRTAWEVSEESTTSIFFFQTNLLVVYTLRITSVYRLLSLTARRTLHGVQDGINLLDDPWHRSLRRSVVLGTLISAEYVNVIVHHSLHADNDLVLYTWLWRPYTAIPVTACHTTPHLALLVAYKWLTTWSLFQWRMLIWGSGVRERYNMPSFTPPLPIN